MTLTEFLLARIAELQAAAERSPQVGDKVASLVAFGTPDAPPILIVHPEYVLADCEAKRRIVALFPHFADGDGWNNAGDEVLSLLVLPYADHPDCREEWKP